MVEVGWSVQRCELVGAQAHFPFLVLRKIFLSINAAFSFLLKNHTFVQRGPLS